jgi:hypothetical protein
MTTTLANIGGGEIVLVTAGLLLMGLLYNIWMLIDCFKNEPATKSRALWATVLMLGFSVFFGWVSAIIYNHVRRRPRIRAAKEAQ